MENKKVEEALEKPRYVAPDYEELTTTENAGATYYYYTYTYY